MISAVGSRWPPGSVDFSDSDEEDERVGVGMSHRQDEGLTSFPVDSWEDTWDDSDAPVSQEVPQSLIIDQVTINDLIKSTISRHYSQSLYALL